MIPRRLFLRLSARAGSALLAIGALPEKSHGSRIQAGSLRLGLLVQPGAAAGTEQGAELAAAEASAAGALLGLRLELRASGMLDAEALVREWRPSGLIGGFDERGVHTGGALAETAGVPFLNIGARLDSLRASECHPLVYHVEASDGMYAAALAATAAQPPGSRAELWHESLERFGAGQLNDRFRARYALGMDGSAWAGWMAVKILWEASLRARSTEPRALLANLDDDRSRFDGNKGWPLSFRASDRQLRQPLYLVAGIGASARLVGEVPERPGTSEFSSRELLDRLGGTDTTPCRAKPDRLP